MKILNLKNLMKYLFWYTDTTFTRLVLGVAALVVATSLALPDPFHRNEWQTLYVLLPARWVWIVLFLGYFVGVFWRFVDAKPRVRWALIVNILGSVLWLSCMFSRYVLSGVTPGTIAEAMLGILSLWVLYRTGLTSEIVTP